MRLAVKNLFVGGVILTVIVLMVIYVLRVGVQVSNLFLPYILVGMQWVFVGNVLVGIPMAIVNRTRGYARTFFYYSSIVYGAGLWMSSAILCYQIWGIFALILGIFILGFGVTPIAIIATLVNGMWFELLFLVIVAALLWATRLYAIEK